MSGVLVDIYDRLFTHFGPQHWWPAQTQFEVMVGAILTQSVAWTNVERAISNLQVSGFLSPEGIRQLPVDELAQLLYPSGYYNAKALKLKALVEYLSERFSDDLEAMAMEDAQTIRKELLNVHGIGEETCDDILLYALGKPVFVIDAYTRRIFHRLGLAPERGPYSTYSSLFTNNLPHDADTFGEYHALIVSLGKDICGKNPVCESCCLLDICPTGKTRSQHHVSGRAIGRALSIRPTRLRPQHL